MNEQTTLRYKDLVFDRAVYPRDVLDGERVAHLKAVLEAGNALSPIIVCAETRKVVDGFHRSQAYFALRGAEAEIPCVERHYESPGDLFLDAIALNAGHGKPLSEADQARCATLARRNGLTVDQIAASFSVRTERITSLAATKPAGPAVPTRRSQIAFATGKSEGDDYEPSRPGFVGLREINPVLTGLQAGRVDMADRRIRHALRALVEVASDRLRVAGASA